MFETPSDKWFCPYCGTENNDNFCIQCGVPKSEAIADETTTEEISAESASWICEVCGNQNHDDFCANCGTKRGTGTAASSTEDANDIAENESKLFCAVCGKPFDGDFCTWCGAPKKDLTTLPENIPPAIITDKGENKRDITSKPAENGWICGVCGQSNVEKFCSNCGNPQGAQKNETSAGAHEWSCIACGRVNDGDFCIYCGTPKNAQPSGSSNITNNGDIRTEYTQAWKCPVCGQINQDRFCIGCGSQYGTKKQNTQQTVLGFIKSHKAVIQKGMILLLVGIACLEGDKIMKVLKKDSDIPGITASAQKPAEPDSSAGPERETSPTKPDTSLAPPSLPALSPEKDAAPESPQIPSPAAPANSDAPDITPDQRAAMSALYSFHSNITQHELRQAYNCLSPGLQGRISYDGWAPGFKTTVSSTASDVKVASSAPDKIVLTYILTAVDNPGGTQTFNGTVSVIRTGDGWKIDEIENRVR